MPQLLPPNPFPFDASSLPLDDINARLATQGLPALAASDVETLWRGGSIWIARLLASHGMRLPPIDVATTVGMAGTACGNGLPITRQSPVIAEGQYRPSRRSPRVLVPQREKIVPRAAAERMRQAARAATVVLCIQVVADAQPLGTSRPENPSGS
jgi:hypothetical protein